MPHRMTTYQADKFVVTAERMMSRRHVEMTDRRAGT